MVYILLEYIAIKGNDKSILGPNNVVFEVFFPANVVDRKKCIDIIILNGFEFKFGWLAGWLGRDLM